MNYNGSDTTKNMVGKDKYSESQGQRTINMGDNEKGADTHGDRCERECTSTCQDVNKNDNGIIVINLVE